MYRCRPRCEASPHIFTIRPCEVFWPFCTCCFSFFPSFSGFTIGRVTSFQSFTAQKGFYATHFLRRAYDQCFPLVGRELWIWSIHKKKLNTEYQAHSNHSFLVLLIHSPAFYSLVPCSLLFFLIPF